MSLPTTKWRLGMHFTVRTFEVLFLYGHFVGIVVFAGDVLEHEVVSLSFRSSVFALPQILVGVLVWLLFGVMLAWEWKSAGLPRVAEPGAWMRRARQALRILLMAAIVVSFLSFVFFIVLLMLARRNTADNAVSWPLSLASILVSALVLVLTTLIHLDWLRRLQHHDYSCLATVPAMVTHVLPNANISELLKSSIQRDSKMRIIMFWTGGLSAVLLGVLYVHGYLPAVPNVSSDGNLLAQFLVGFVFYVWISVSATIYLAKSAKREVGIVNGTYTAPARRVKLVTLYFAVVFMAGLVLALTCFATNLYRTIMTLVVSNLTFVVFAALITAWAPLLFYAGLCMDIFLIHVRNDHEDQSVCTRLPIPLTMGSEYSSVTDNTLSYDADF